MTDQQPSRGPDPSSPALSGSGAPGPQPPAWDAAPQPPAWDAAPQPPAWDRGPTGADAVAPADWGPPPAYGAPGQGPYGYGPAAGVGQQQGSGKAVAALVLAIASFLVVPLVPAVVSLVLARQARRDIDASGGRVGGAGMVTASRILSWINIVLSVLAALLVAVAIVVALNTSGSTT